MRQDTTGKRTDRSSGRNQGEILPPPKMRVFCSFLILGVVVPVLLQFIALPVLHGDQILLKSGNRLEGRIEPVEGGKIRVVVDEGQWVVVALDQIAERVSKVAPIDEFKQRADQLLERGRRDRGEWIELARWGEERGLRRTSRRAWQEVMRIDPHHVGARNRLGYAVHENRWVRREELENRGLKRFRGVYMTDAEIAELRSTEAAAELTALLVDASHENRFVRENAMLRILELSDPMLLPALRAMVRDEEPLTRMLVGRALANYPFSDWASHLYKAFLSESREEVRSAWAAVLRGTSRPEIGAWLARDLAAPGDDSVRRRSLLILMKTCPTRHAVGPLIGWLEETGWGPVAGRLLEDLLAQQSMGSEEWRQWWERNKSQLSEDLGTGWLSNP